MRTNPILLTDCYNVSHYDLVPEEGRNDIQVSHLYNRKRPMILFGFNEFATNFFGTTKFTRRMVDDAAKHAERLGLQFPTELWMRVVDECHGWLPLKVQALPDGTYCPAGTPFAQIRNTKKGYGELVTWFEAPLLHNYFASGCATEAFRMREYLEANRCSPWKFHSFGFRGHQSLESAIKAGKAWNLFLHGTDDFHMAEHTPSAEIGSISASAHKVMQQWDDELEGCKHALTVAATRKEKMIAMPIDTYDAHNFIENYVVPLGNLAWNYDMKVIFRPDSGNVIEQAIMIWNKLDVLDLKKNVGVIIGEGMNYDKAREYDAKLKIHNIPLDFVFYGIGAGFYKHIDRDWLGWAMKTAFAGGKPRMKFSNDAIKRSIPGAVNLIRNALGDMMVIQEGEIPIKGLYQTIYSYSPLKNHSDDPFEAPTIRPESWETIQKRAMSNVGKSQAQENIILSPRTQELISEFRTKYLKKPAAHLNIEAR